MKKKTQLFFLVFVFILFNSVVVFAQEANDIKWTKEPSIIDSDGKKIEITGALHIPDNYKGKTKVKLTVNGFNVVPDKNGN